MTQAAPRPAQAAAALDEHQTVQRLRAAIRAAVPSCDSHSLANLAWAHAETALGPADLPSLLLERLLALRGVAEDREVANVVRLCALDTRDRVDERSVRTLLVLLQPRLATWHSHALAVLAWALATLGVANKGTFAAIAGAALECRDALTPRTASSLAWAFARTGHHHSRKEVALFARVADEILAHATADAAPLHHYAASPQDVSNLLWAFATAGDGARRAGSEGRARWPRERADRLCSALVTQFAADAARAGDVGLANAAWAAAELGLYDPRFMHAVLRRAADLTPALSLHAAAVLVWACGRLGHRHDAATSVLADAAAVHLSRAAAPPHARSLSMLLHGFATAGLGDSAAVQRCARLAVGALAADAAALPEQALANACWALAALGLHVERPHMERLIAEAFSRGSAFKLAELSQLAQANLALLLEAPWYRPAFSSCDAHAFLRALYVLGAAR